MTAKQKKIGKVLIVALIIVIALPLIANFIIKQKIESAIENLPKSVKLKYEDLDVSFLSGDMELSSPTFTVGGEVSERMILNAKIESLKISDFSYWEYIINGNIKIRKLKLDSIVLNYLHNANVERKSYDSKLSDKIKRSVIVEHVNILKSDIHITDFETDSTMIRMPQLSFEMNNFSITPKSSKAKIPFEYGTFTLRVENLEWAVGTYESLWTKTLDISNSEASFQEIKLKTKYSKQKLSSVIQKERDHFDVKIKSLKLNAMDYGFTDSNKFFFKVDSTSILQPKATIYRDKSIADDTTEKSLYGKMLRNLNFELGLETVKISSGRITYAEKIKDNDKAGTLDFKDVNADISKLGNVYGKSDTSIDVNAEFMEDTPLDVDWNFKVNDSTDQFTFKADLGFLKAGQLDQFTEPNLNVDLDGEIIQTFFAINGNPDTSNIDLKIKYEDFKVSILEDRGKDKKGLLSGLVNLFVSKNSENQPGDFRYGHANNIDRDKSKSVFNFIWLNIKEGLKSAMSGDGEKKNN